MSSIGEIWNIKEIDDFAANFDDIDRLATQLRCSFELAQYLIWLEREIKSIQSNLAREGGDA